MDVVAGCHFHPTLPLLASSSGQRHFSHVNNMEHSEGEFKDISSDERRQGRYIDRLRNSMQVWMLPYCPLEFAEEQSLSNVNTGDGLTGGSRVEAGDVVESTMNFDSVSSTIVDEESGEGRMC